MNVPSLNATSDIETIQLEIQKNHNLQANWKLIDYADVVGQRPKSKPKPEFDNNVDRIVYELEHENDLLEIDLSKQFIDKITKDMAEEI